jgi:hypothetical protein
MGLDFRLFVPKPGSAAIALQNPLSIIAAITPALRFIPTEKYVNDEATGTREVAFSLLEVTPNPLMTSMND